MLWIKSHVEIWDHWKTIKLAEKLKIDLPQTVGHLHALWHFVLIHAWTDANLEKWGEAGIKQATRWPGDANEIVAALQDCGFLDNFIVHGWSENAGKLVSDRLYVANKRRYSATNDDNLRQTTARREEKRVEEKRVEEKKEDICADPPCGSARLAIKLEQEGATKPLSSPYQAPTLTNTLADRVITTVKQPLSNGELTVPLGKEGAGNAGYLPDPCLLLVNDIDISLRGNINRDKDKDKEGDGMEGEEKGKGKEKEEGGHFNLQKAAIKRIWDYYVSKLNKNPKTLTFTPARQLKGLARLAEALKKVHNDLPLAEEMLRLVIDALAASEFHNGANDRKKCYNSWERNLFPSTEKFESWLEQAFENAEKSA